MVYRFKSLILLAAVAVGLATTIPILPVKAQDSSAEEELHVHRLDTETTAPYDAFAYANRIAREPLEGQSPVDYAGTILYSRLSNLEGRIQVKIIEGFKRPAYLGYKTFMRAWPEEGSAVGNCVVCHTPPNFASDEKYIVDASGEPKAAPSLRNLDKSKDELEAIIRRKMKTGEKARAGEMDVHEAYKLIDLDETSIENVASFLMGLKEVPKDDFRDLITHAEILDTSDLIE